MAGPRWECTGRDGRHRSLLKCVRLVSRSPTFGSETSLSVCWKPTSPLAEMKGRRPDFASATCSSVARSLARSAFSTGLTKYASAKACSIVSALAGRPKTVTTRNAITTTAPPCSRHDLTAHDHCAVPHDASQRTSPRLVKPPGPLMIQTIGSIVGSRYPRTVYCGGSRKLPPPVWDRGNSAKRPRMAGKSRN